MPLAAERVEALFEIFQIEREMVRDLEEVVDNYAVKDVPQPQLFLALGLWNTNPDCISVS